MRAAQGFDSGQHRCDPVFDRMAAFLHENACKDAKADAEFVPLLKQARESAKRGRWISCYAFIAEVFGVGMQSVVLGFAGLHYCTLLLAPLAAITIVFVLAADYKLQAIS